MRCRLVIFDWAGTLIDFGCRAPLVAFLDAFERCGVPIDEATARRPMGAHKRDHVREILAEPAVAERARAVLDLTDARSLDATLGETIYRAFTTRLLEVLPQHAAPIPGAVDTLQWLREHDIAIGSTSGYTRPMMDAVEPLARRHGIDPEIVICADELPRGRPAPWGCFRIAERLDRFPLADAVKVGDTPADMAEGNNAGMRSVGITASGNEVGLDEARLAQLPPATRRALIATAATRLAAAGAEATLWSVAELPAWLEAQA